MRQRTLWLLSGVGAAMVSCGDDSGGDTDGTTATTMMMSATDPTTPSSSSSSSDPDDDSSTTEDCPLGTIGCPCGPGESCDDDAVCESDMCVEPGTTTATDTDATTSSGTTGPAECGNGVAEPGDLCFGPVDAESMGAGVVDVVLFDAEGNGSLDIATADATDNTVSFRAGSGAGMFGTRDIYSASSSPLAVASADFDGDGNADLVSLDAPETVDDEGAVSFFAGNGLGAFDAPSSTDVGMDPSAIAVGDVTNDMVADALVADATGETVTVLGGGEIPFAMVAGTETTGAGPTAMHLADFAVTGLDLVVADGGATTVRLLLGNNMGGFGGATIADLDEAPRAVTTGDFDSDGDLDVAVATASSVTIIFGTGNGGFAGQIPTNAGNSLQDLVAADFDIDGVMDVAVASTGDHTVRILLGNDDGTFTEAMMFDVGMSPVAIVAGDINGDGLPDIATANEDDGNVSIIPSEA